jgi:hypothetical protein
MNVDWQNNPAEALRLRAILLDIVTGYQWYWVVGLSESRWDLTLMTNTTSTWELHQRIEHTVIEDLCRSLHATHSYTSEHPAHPSTRMIFQGIPISVKERIEGYMREDI